MRRVVLLAFLGMTACVPGSPGAIATDSPQALQSETDGALCNAFGMNHQAKVRAELERRGTIPAAEWPDVISRQVRVGMSACAALAALGPPEAINRTASIGSFSEQWVYEGLYVYTNGKVVTSWQN